MKNVIHIISLAMVLACCLPIKAQEQEVEPLMPGESPKPTKYIAVEDEKEHLVFFQGFTLAVDAYGPIAYLVSDYGTAEAALRINLKNTFFPIVELGYGKCEKNDLNTNISYKMKAPYGRVGIDINMLKNKFQDNRLYLGARYGLSKFQYDMSGPAMVDPIWGGSQPYDFKGIDCTSHWVEFLFGVEVKIYRNFHMGWSVRYKREISSTKSDYAKPSCIPGYGYTTNSTCWGANYTLIFDLNWGKKKSHKRGINVEIKDIPQENEEVELPNETNKEENAEEKESIENTQEEDNGEETDTDDEQDDGEATEE